jgi:hypothetical protein
LNVFFLLPWLVVSPLLIAFTPSRRNFFDISAGTDVERPSASLKLTSQPR